MKTASDKITQIESTQNLEDSEKRLNLALRIARQGWFDVNIKTGQVEVSPEYPSMLGYDPAEFTSTVSNWMANVHDDDLPHLKDRFKMALETGTVQEMQYRRRNKAGEWLWIHSVGQVSEWDPAGHPLRMIGIHMDITERKRDEDRLKQSNADLSATLLAIPDMLFELSEVGEYVKVWTRTPELLANQKESLIGHTVAQVLSDDAANTVMSAIREAAVNGTSFGKIISIDLSDGRRWFELSTSAKFQAEQSPRHFMMLSRDITDRFKAQEQVEHIAYHDPLTGLPNRALLLDRLNHLMAVSRRTQRFGAILFIDLDEFKRINDFYGHSFGDKVLKTVANTLSQSLREGDTVCRLGGDEFVVLLSDLAHDKESAVSIAHTIGEKLRTALELSNLIDGRPYTATASLGISLFPRQDETSEDLIREADIAMYRAKEYGRNNIVFFENDMQAAIAQRFALEQGLRESLKTEGFRLFLQSKVDSTGAVIGAEALVRWHHPEHGIVMPVTFISLAEEVGIICAIGEWVLRETCQLLVRLNTMGINLNLAVNVSPRQFHQQNFITRTKQILTETGADPLHLTFEFTENLLVERTLEVISRMLELAELGIQFSIDDFGTGYSSLSYLKRLPLNEIKIDKSFVRDIPHDTNDVALVDTILSMAHHLDLKVVAEGVETEEQFKFLAARKCEHYQGYLFHRPQLAQEWLASLKKNEG